MIYPDKRIESAQTRDFQRKDKTTCAVVTNMMAYMGTRAHVVFLRPDGALFCLCRSTRMLNARWNWSKVGAPVLDILLHDDAGVDHVESSGGQRTVYLNTDPLVIKAIDTRGEEHPCEVCIRCENALFTLAGVKHQHHYGIMVGTAYDTREYERWKAEEPAWQAEMEAWERRARADREAWDNLAQGE